MSLPIPLDISLDGLASDLWMAQDGKVSLNACMKDFPLNCFVLIFAINFEHVLIKDIFLGCDFFATDSFHDFTMQQSLVLMMNHCFSGVFLLFKNAGILDRAWTIVVKMLTLLLLYFAQRIVMLFSFQEVVSWEDSVEVSSYNSHIAALLAEMV